MCSNIPAAPAYGVYIALNIYDMLELEVPIGISLMKVAANKEAIEPRVPFS
jgi:hypothetical protein